MLLRAGRSTTCAPGEATEVLVRLCADLLARVEVLLDLGLGYLSLGRSSTTLSPGEAQRLRIATQLRSGLFGVVYVLDEPSAGLHPADAEPLLDVLDRLKASGNTLFVVEHDLDVVRRADWVVDIGPAAGEGGGRGPVLRAGRRAGGRRGVRDRPLPVRPGAARRRARPRAAHAAGLAAPARRLAPQPARRRGRRAAAGADRGHRRLRLRQVHPGHPGARGGGAPPPRAGPRRAGRRAPGGRRRGRRGLDSFDRLVRVDQRPIGRTPRSNLATYTGLFDAVRKPLRGHRRGALARVRRRPLLVQRGRGPVRDLPGRGVRRRRAALPARQLRRLPGLPRRPLQRARRSR